MATQTPEITITVEARDSSGPGETGRMRNQGRVPSVLYGGDMPPVHVVPTNDAAFYRLIQ